MADRSALGDGRAWFVAAIVAAAAVLAFWPALDNPFVNWDDKENFLDNPHYRGLGPRQLWWAWTGIRIGVYQPLSWMLFEAQYELFGLDPWGYHLVSILLHAATAVALYFLILALLQRAMSGAPLASPTAWPRLIGAGTATLLFAVHPLRTEVVAWVSCQPYLPCALLFVLATGAYLRGHPAPGVVDRRWLRYTFALFVGALLSKAVAVSLPIVLLILDWYPLRRFGTGTTTARELGAVLREKTLFAAVSAIFVVVTAAVRPHAPLADVPPWHYLGQLAQAAYAIWFYLAKTIVPTGLNVYYAFPVDSSRFTWPFQASVLAAVLVTALLYRVRRRAPAMLAAWAAYLVIVAPNLGLVQFSRQYAADRYSYVSHMGLVALCAAGIVIALRRMPRGMIAAGAVGVMALAVAATLVLGSWTQSKTWSASEVLWTHALRHNGADISEIQNHLAVTLVETNQAHRAEQYLREAVRLSPRSADARHNLGALLANQGRIAEADALFVDALRLNPNHALAHMNHGTVLVKKGEVIEGLRAYIRALELNPESDVPSRLRSLLLGKYDLDRNLAPLIWPLVDDPGDSVSLEALKRAIDSR